eukprot:m.201146 g.201146  ORF g.201146 m.201146 type:complete len:1260 (+) comp15342_c0_seq3:81-3860(+)
MKSMQEEAEAAAVVLADDSQDKINAMTSIAPLIVGITGPSGVGKSTIAMQAAEKIREAVYCPIELPEFFLTPLSPGQSYSDRDPVSETPANVNFAKTVKEVVRAARQLSSLPTESQPHPRRRVLLVDHYLLLESPELLELMDRIVFLSPWAGVGAPPFPPYESEADSSARDLCCRRRIDRKAARDSGESDQLCRYYTTAVWPAFHRHVGRSAAEMLSSERVGSYDRILLVDGTMEPDFVVNAVASAVKKWCLEVPLQGPEDRLALLEWRTQAVTQTITTLRQRCLRLNARLCKSKEVEHVAATRSHSGSEKQVDDLIMLRDMFTQTVIKTTEGGVCDSDVLEFLKTFASCFSAKKFKAFITTFRGPFSATVSSCTVVFRCLWLTATVQQNKQKAITSILIDCLSTASIEAQSQSQNLGLGLLQAIVDRAYCVAHISPMQQVKLLRVLNLRFLATRWLRTECQLAAVREHVHNLWVTDQQQSSALQFEYELGCSGYFISRQDAMAGLVKVRDLSTLQWYAGDVCARRNAITIATNISPTFAKSIATEWGLISEFPDLGWMAFRARLFGLVKKKKGQLAATMCGNATEHHVFLVDELIRTNQRKAAREVRDLLLAGCPESPVRDVSIPDGDEVEGLQSPFLQLTLPKESIVLVDDGGALEGLIHDIEAVASTNMVDFDDVTTVPVVGLDAEWKPSLGRTQNPPSLLQIGFRHRVYVIDLLSVMAISELRKKLAGAVSALFHSRSVLKLGVAFEGDLRLLRTSFPDLRCFDECHNLLDGAILLQAHSGHLPLRLLKKRTTGLAAVVRGILGQELDKSCQCSNWEVRPLTKEQFAYAALDAISLVLCYDQLAKTNARAAHAAVEAAESVIAGVANVGNAYEVEPLSHNDVEAALAESGSTTAKLVSSQTQIDGGSVGKTLAFKTGSGNVAICCTRADRKIDVRKLGRITGTRCRLLGARQCVEKLGYPPGSIPPIGHRTQFPCFVDATWHREVWSAQGQFILGGGSPYHSLVMDSEALDVLTKCTVVDLHVEEVDERGPEGGGEGFGADGEYSLEHRFLATTEVNRLARWLRVVGVDVSTPSEQSHDVLFRMASDERRLILTCNRQLASRRDALACFLLEANDVETQFRTVISHFGIAWDDSRFMSICSKCGIKGFEGPMSSAEVLEKFGLTMPKKVQANVEHFWVCQKPECRTVYWVGRKYADADTKFRSFFEGDGSPRPPAEADVNLFLAKKTFRRSFRPRDDCDELNDDVEVLFADTDGT